MGWNHPPDLFSKNHLSVVLARTVATTRLSHGSPLMTQRPPLRSNRKFRVLTTLLALGKSGSASSEGTLKRGTSVLVPTSNLITSRISLSAAVLSSITDCPFRAEKSITTSYRSAMPWRNDVTVRLFGRKPASLPITVNGMPLLSRKLNPRDTVATRIRKRYIVGSTRMEGHGTPLTSITLPSRLSCPWSSKNSSPRVVYCRSFISRGTSYSPRGNSVNGAFLASASVGSWRKNPARPRYTWSAVWWM